MLAGSKNPIAAYELVKFLSNDKESAMMFATKQFLFPSLKSVLEDPAFIDQKFEFYGGQQVNELFAEIAKTVDTDFGWLPFMDYVYSSYEETIKSVISAKGDLSEGLDKRQEQLVSYAKEQGFTVKVGTVVVSAAPRRWTPPLQPQRDHAWRPQSPSETDH